MNFQSMKDIKDIQTIRIKDSWNKCVVELEHSVSGEYYWLDSFIKFYDGNGPSTLMRFGRCHKSDPKLIFSFLQAQGFQQTNRRVMREWEYYDFERVASLE
jgi:hypothetical protein